VNIKWILLEEPFQAVLDYPNALAGANIFIALRATSYLASDKKVGLGESRHKVSRFVGWFI